MTTNTTTQLTTEILKALGAKEWKTETHHRFYFNDLRGLYGLKMTFYGTGNISSATLDGESISNCSAKKIATELDFGKIWFDANTNQFGSKEIGSAKVSAIIDEIETRAAALAPKAPRTNKSVMTRAWEIAREAVKKFGGKVKEFFAMSLKLAWAE